MKTTTYDVMAAELLLSGEKPGSPKFRALAAQARAALGGECECPDCGCLAEHDDNGESRCCVQCGCHFESK